MVNVHTMRPVRARFMDRVSIAVNGCWVWDHVSPSARYGVMYAEGRKQLAHRVSYELFVGPLQEGLVIDHLCANTHCVNPRHLQQVTQQVNVARHHDKQTQCKRGHPYTEESTLIRGNTRHCRPCGAIRNREYYARKKEEKR